MSQIIIPFLSLKGTTQVYLLKILITHNKQQSSLSNLLKSCISAKPAPQILSTKSECYSNFLIIGLCNFFQ